MNSKLASDTLRKNIGIWKVNRNKCFTAFVPIISAQFYFVEHDVCALHPSVENNEVSLLRTGKAGGLLY